MIFIKNGRVIDPARGVDRVEDVLIEGGKIAAAGEEASARAAAAGRAEQMRMTHSRAGRNSQLSTQPAWWLRLVSWTCTCISVIRG